MTIDVLALSVAGAAVLAIGGVAAAVYSLTRRKHEIIVDRLADPVMMAAPFEALLPQPTEGGERSVVTRIADVISRVARPAGKDELNRLRLKLQCAGYRGEGAVSLFLGSKVVLALVVLAVALWLDTKRVADSQPTLLVAVVAFAIGFYLPDVVLASKVKDRQTEIERGLPDALDLLVTCVEAGLGLDAALQRVAGEVMRAWPLLGRELQTTFLEVKAGMPRVDAFRRLASRTGVADLKSLAATLNQTETFGTSISLALRIQAEGMRTRRMQRAEERAGMAAVKMTIPLILCILPALIALVVGPAAVSIWTSFIKG